MNDSVRVLVYGSIDQGSCDMVRFGLYRDLLPAHGVEMRNVDQVTGRVPVAFADRPAEAVALGLAELDLSDFEWADVIVFRRYYYTSWCCQACDTASRTRAEIDRHAERTGHPVRDQLEFVVRPLFDRIERDPSFLRGKAVVYETDDDLFAVQPWTGFSRAVLNERDLMERMLRRADLVTVTTPVLGRSVGRFNDEVRVIRNAIDPTLYPDPSTLPALEGDPRILYYGSAIRLRDYEIARPAIDWLTARRPETRRVWLGGGQQEVDPAIERAVDEAYPYVKGIPAFARRLVELRPDIGLAPVLGDDFDRAHSELHWLEYSMAGAATVATRTMAGGPYDVIRAGVDGLVAKSRADWRDALRRLAASRALRDELAGNARERVLAEYDIRTRAAEWAAAYRWAAEHAGRGRLGRLHVVGAPAVEAAEAESKATFAHRLRVRHEAAEATARLAELRRDRDVCWPEEDAANPLVTVRIPTYNRGPLVVERAINSALAQTYPNLEVLIVGDGATPETIGAIERVTDPRVRFVNLPDRVAYPVDAEHRWMIAGWPAVNHALEIARGAWIAPLDDDDEFTPDHVELLLSVATEYRLEFVYGQSLMQALDGTWSVLGDWPPRHAAFCHGSVLYSARLRFMTYDPESWRLNEPADWNLWRRMIEAGVRMGNVEQVVYRHYAEARHRAAA